MSLFLLFFKCFKAVGYIRFSDLGEPKNFRTLKSPEGEEGGKTKNSVNSIFASGQTIFLKENKRRDEPRQKKKTKRKEERNRKKRVTRKKRNDPRKPSTQTSLSRKEKRF